MAAAPNASRTQNITAPFCTAMNAMVEREAKMAMHDNLILVENTKIDGNFLIGPKIGVSQSDQFSIFIAPFVVTTSVLYFHFSLCLRPNMFTFVFPHHSHVVWRCLP
jgi:hypothetical protein